MMDADAMCAAFIVDAVSCCRAALQPRAWTCWSLRSGQAISSRPRLQMQPGTMWTPSKACLASWALHCLAIRTEGSISLDGAKRVMTLTGHQLWLIEEVMSALR